jgi:hypothetical protein
MISLVVAPGLIKPETSYLHTVMVANIKINVFWVLGCDNRIIQEITVFCVLRGTGGQHCPVPAETAGRRTT